MTNLKVVLVWGYASLLIQSFMKTFRQYFSLSICIFVKPAKTYLSLLLIFPLFIPTRTSPLALYYVTPQVFAIWDRSLMPRL